VDVPAVVSLSPFIKKYFLEEIPETPSFVFFSTEYMVTLLKGYVYTNPQYIAYISIYIPGLP
jgi:hypothetical protein